MKETDLTGIVAEHIDAVNAADTDRAVATFADDAYVNDNRREFVGIDAIRRWVAKEMVGDKVRIEVREVLDHYGDTVVRGAYDGTFDRTDLPDEIVLTNYFSVRDGQIVSLVDRLQPARRLLTCPPPPPFSSSSLLPLPSPPLFALVRSLAPPVVHGGAAFAARLLPVWVVWLSCRSGCRPTASWLRAVQPVGRLLRVAPG